MNGDGGGRVVNLIAGVRVDVLLDQYVSGKDRRTEHSMVFHVCSDFAYLQ